MANLSDFRVDIVPGPGLIARFPTAMLVVPAFKPEQRPAIQDLLDVCKATTGSSLARRLAEKVLSVAEDGLPGFAAIAEVDGRLNAFLYGAAHIDGSGSGGSVHLSGTDAATWVDRALDGNLTSLAFGATDAMPTAEGGLFDLGLGVVPGKGAMLTLTGAPAAPPARPAGQGRRPAAPAQAQTPAPPEQPPAPAEAAAPPAPPVAEPVAEAEPDFEEDAPDAEEAVTDFFPPVDAATPRAEPSRPGRKSPQRSGANGQAAGAAAATPGTATPAGEATPPVATTPPAPEPEPAPEPAAAPAGAATPDARARAKQSAIVKGVICPGPGRHFNHPDALNCWQDGLSMVHITRLLVDGQRPSLGTLVLDDGSAQEVDSDFVVGRQPQDDPDVQAGTAKGFTLVDPSRLVSGRHAALKLVGWEVYVEDLGSRNGTFAISAAGKETAVGAKPVLIESGASVRVGNRRLTYHSHHRVK